MQQQDEQRIFGFGFRVVMQNPPLREVWGEAEVDMNEASMQTLVVRALLRAPFRWTGEHVRYLRHAMNLTQRELAEWMGLSSHATVVKWEQAGPKPTKMDRPTEIVLRQVVSDRFSHDPALADVGGVDASALRAMVVAAEAVESPTVVVDGSEPEPRLSGVGPTRRAPPVPHISHGASSLVAAED